jgi:hypothetical protein
MSFCMWVLFMRFSLQVTIFSLSQDFAPEKFPLRNKQRARRYPAPPLSSQHFQQFVDFLHVVEYRGRHFYVVPGQPDVNVSLPQAL